MGGDVGGGVGGHSGGGRLLRRVVTMAALAVTVMAAAIGVLPAAPAAAAPTITVTPNEDLLDGSIVTVTLEGLDPGGAYLVTMCGTEDDDTCFYPELGGSGARYIPAFLSFVRGGSDGRASVQLELVRSFGFDGTTYDCTGGGCRIGLLSDVSSQLATPALDFQPTGTYQWPEADLTVTGPDRGVVERNRVTLVASGLSPFGRHPFTAPSAHAWVDQCRDVDDPGPDDCVPGSDVVDWSPSQYRYVQVGADGTAQGSTVVGAFLDLPGGRVDCAAEGCGLRLRQARGATSDLVPLTFAPEWTPYDSAADLLHAWGRVRGRPASDTELAELSAGLADRSVRAADLLVDAAVEGADSTGTTVTPLADVVRTYRAFFGRSPEGDGLRYWALRLRRGLTVTEMGRQFGGTAEFRRTYGTSSNAQAVDRAYRNMLGRAPEADGLAYWTARLDGGLARWKMIVGFARSSELRRREADRVAITLLTWRLAGRAPSSAELLGYPPYDPEDPSSTEGGTIRNVVVTLLSGPELPPT